MTEKVLVIVKLFVFVDPREAAGKMWSRFVHSDLYQKYQLLGEQNIS